MAWVFLNTLIDYDERRSRVHVECLPDFDKDYCEVCHKPMAGGGIRAGDLPPGVKPEDVYVPRRDGEIGDLELREPLEIEDELGV
jgi:hypothetical protein